ncbi:hypothetical protein F5Y01DRAFT_320310 [Xylaria sp. FL0043]|nr:hypothetical protein F5Y01DRAFT_320310 [Xylaria sp. FL0043]
MSLFSNQVSSAPAESIVETNNFHEVLQHFNDACELVDKTTRFTIECQICQCRNLAVTNPESETPAEDTHENYIVLPYCGHAFGSHCLQKVCIRRNLLSVNRAETNQADNTVDQISESSDTSQSDLPFVSSTYRL